MKLIDKDALIEKLWERRIKHHDFGGSPHSEYGHEDDEILSLINTLEVKEVDFEREMQAFALLYLEPLKISDSNIGISITMSQLYSCAKYFFELGLKA